MTGSHERMYHGLEGLLWVVFHVWLKHNLRPLAKYAMNDSFRFYWGRGKGKEKEKEWKAVGEKGNVVLNININSTVRSTMT